MTENKMDRGTDGEHVEARLDRWVSSVGTVTLPLLAGFSITAVVVVSDNPANFEWPGATILILATAALVLIVAVQSAYHAHVYLSKDDPDHKRAVSFAKRTRRFYDVGLLALLAGLALIVIPHHATSVQAGFRWTGVILVGLAWIGECIWLILDPWLRTPSSHSEPR